MEAACAKLHSNNWRAVAADLTPRTAIGVNGRHMHWLSMAKMKPSRPYSIPEHLYEDPPQDDKVLPMAQPCREGYYRRTTKRSVVSQLVAYTNASQPPPLAPTFHFQGKLQAAS